MLKEREVVAWNCTTFIQSIGIHVEAVVAMSASQCFTSTSPFINKVCTGTMRAHNFSFSRDGIETKHCGTRHQHAVENTVIYQRHRLAVSYVAWSEADVVAAQMSEFEGSSSILRI